MCIVHYFPDRFSVSFDVGEFQPDEIRVTTENRRLKVNNK